MLDVRLDHGALGRVLQVRELRHDQRVRLSALAIVAVLGAACSSTRTPAAPELSPRETFEWSGQAMSFSPPPAGWRREGETSGGIKGARFVKERSVGEGIGVGDYYILADRHRSAYLREMISKVDSYDTAFGWDRALRKAYAHTDLPFSTLESEIAGAINNSVSQADLAFRNHDRDAARVHLQAALAEADRLRFSLSDVIDRVEFKPERRQEPEYYKMLGRRETVVAGEPAVVVDYTVKVPERTITYAGREVYVVHNSHLFICTFIGLQETLAVFDAVVASIEFPK